MYDLGCSPLKKKKKYVYTICNYVVEEPLEALKLCHGQTVLHDKFLREEKGVNSDYTD